MILSALKALALGLTVMFLFWAGINTAPPDADAHGLGGRVANHHKWISMAVNCETRGIANRWHFNGHHDGGLQFSPATWTSAVANHPHLARYAFAYQAPAWVQMAAANINMRRYGLSGQWSCWKFWR